MWLRAQVANLTRLLFSESVRALLLSLLLKRDSIAQNSRDAFDNSVDPRCLLSSSPSSSALNLRAVSTMSAAEPAAKTMNTAAACPIGACHLLSSRLADILQLVCSRGDESGEPEPLPNAQRRLQKRCALLSSRGF